MAIKADDVKHPDQIEDVFDWDTPAQGERPDMATHRTLRLANRAVAKFPELSGKYKAYAGAAAVVSSALTLMAGIAITRKMKHGMSADSALASITAADIENAMQVAVRDQRYKRLLRKITLRHRNGQSAAKSGDLTRRPSIAAARLMQTSTQARDRRARFVALSVGILNHNHH